MQRALMKEGGQIFPCRRPKRSAVGAERSTRDLRGVHQNNHFPPS